MKWSRTAAAIVAALVAGMYGRATPSAQQRAPDLAGRWTLNRALSASPQEIGFDADWMKSSGSDASPSSSGGRGRRGSSGSTASGAFSARPESAEDASRVRQLTAEVRNPTAHLTIAQAPGVISLTDDQGRARTFHPNGREEVLQLGDVPLVVTTIWDSEHLVIVYSVEQGRQLRYTYTTSANPRQLIVDIKFVERDGGDEVRRVYEPADSNERPAAAATTASAATAAKPGAGVPASAPDASRAAATGEHPVFNQQPGAELKGLTTLGLVVEELSTQATACGLSQSAIETAASKALSDAGLTVRRNADEDTYVYVDIVTTKLPSGLCVSRYDASLYTHTTAKLSYQETPVLVQVSLLHNGGLAGGAGPAHAAGVLQGVAQYVGQFASQIRDANK